MRLKLLLITLLLYPPLVALLPHLAHAQTCTPAPLDKYRYLRRLSLDLRGHLPSYEELAALDPLPDVPPEWIDKWLQDPQFLQVARALHETWLWPNISNVSMSDVAVTLAENNNTQIWSVQGAGRRKLWRKGTGSEVCGNWQQTQFDNGVPIAQAVTDSTGKVLYQQDGWVEVKPYWAPETTIHVCAFDAMTADQGLKNPCGTRIGVNDAHCGCGPNLRWCYAPGVQTEVEVQLREQFLRAVDDAVLGKYQELLTSLKIWLNPRLDFWRKYLAPMSTSTKTWNMPTSSDPPQAANPDWMQTTWYAANRAGQLNGMGLHSGILTLPAYALRFQTNRGRANHFRIVFESQYFIPPASTLDHDCVQGAADLTTACLCRGCHQVLEPLAAYFAPLTEAGSSVVTDAEMPDYDPKCDPAKTKNPTPTCDRFYATDPAAARPGWRLTHQWANLGDPLHQRIAQNLQQGPGGFAKQALESGSFVTATVQNLWKVLLHRPVIVDPLAAEDETAQLTQLAAHLQKSGDFRALVKELVQLPSYRSVR